MEWFRWDSSNNSNFTIYSSQCSICRGGGVVGGGGGEGNPPLVPLNLQVHIDP